MLRVCAHHGAVLLTSSERHPWTLDGFRALFRKTCIRAGIKDLHFHDLREAVIRARQIMEHPNQFPNLIGLGHVDILDGDPNAKIDRLNIHYKTTWS